VVDYADTAGANDVVFESQGVKVAIDTHSLAQLDCMAVDYVKTNDLNEGFTFRNPRIKDMCGCGESFSVQARHSNEHS
jgi:iron-sulfur cluster assembly protein